MESKKSERGAVAVEFALLLPVLLLLVIGIMEFGRAYNIQVSASEGAREGARYAAVNYANAGFSQASVQSHATAAAPSVPATGTSVTVSYSNGNCSNGGTVTVHVIHQLSWMTGYLPIAPPRIQGIGVMQCGG